jgi:hypothetical protein
MMVKIYMQAFALIKDFNQFLGEATEVKLQVYILGFPSPERSKNE